MLLLYKIFLSVALLVLVLGLTNKQLKRYWLNGPFVAMMVGIATGPHGFNIVNPGGTAQVFLLLEQASRITMTIGLLAAGLQLTPQTIRGQLKSIVLTLALIMPLMWVITSLLAYSILALPLAMAVLIGGILTPTDPIVSSTILNGDLAEKNIPQRIKTTILTESGVNDGLGFPFVAFALVLVEGSHESIGDWLTHAVMLKTVLTMILAGAIGLGFAKLQMWAEARDWLEKQSFLTLSFALCLLVTAFFYLVGMNEILAAFVTGLAYSGHIDGQARSAESRAQETLDRLCSLPFFYILGFCLPFPLWQEQWTVLLGFALAVLFLRRPLAFILTYPLFRGRFVRQEISFMAWFGPLGVAAIYYIVTEGSKHQQLDVWRIASFVIFCSVVVHGLSSSPLTQLIGQTLRRGSQTVPKQQG
jgi:NhaP-type Na+/H+ or K+/H+ antiporter